MNAFENPHLYYYSLVPIGIAIIVALSFILALLWCCCRKGRRIGNPVPKAQGNVESRGAEPNPGTCSGSQKSNQLESGETANMLYPHLDPVTPKNTSPLKKYIRGASQTEQLLENTDDRSPDSSFRTLELGQLFESATLASRGPFDSRTGTLPSPKPQPFDSSNDSPHCVSPYSQSQEKITTNSPLLDYRMCHSQRPTVVKIGDNFKFTEKQTLEDLRNSEIIVTSSIELQTSINSNSSHKRSRPAEVEDDIVDMHVKKSRNSFNLEESLRKVRQQSVESNERSNCNLMSVLEDAINEALEEQLFFQTFHESFLTPEQTPLQNFDIGNTDSSTIPIYPSLTNITKPEDVTATLFLRSFYWNNNHLAIIGNHKEIRKSSSTSSVFIDSNTVAQPNMKHTLKSVALAVHNLLIFDSRNQQPRNLDVFDERLHPISSHNAICFDSCLIPETKTIYRFMKQLFYPAELTPECAIISLIYLERLLIYAGIHISVFTWKRILFGSILLASKVWNDKAVWNVDYCQLFEELQVDDVNKMERYFFDLLQLDVNVPLSLYAKYYFDLRTLGQLNNISLPLELLTKQKAVQLEAISTHSDDDIESFQLNRSNSLEKISLPILYLN
ncbi:Cyclin-Y-like [Oopsacas minuta]|uniref:Cyclin-Y-like n=1 Tax=Oopsacas minuta TaxID=111878 RepID=A0AAV7JTP0_9METZ|nr:Cyclin-Y-like [Oopsacas minuta]